MQWDDEHLRSTKFQMCHSRTPRISSTAKNPPPPFRPFSATIAPGKRPRLPTPCGVPRSFNVGLKRRGTRAPKPIIREDSRKMELSESFEVWLLESVSPQMRPATTISSYMDLSDMLRSEWNGEPTYLRCGGGIT